MLPLVRASRVRVAHTAHDIAHEAPVWVPAGVVSCSRHGSSAWCYIQPSGRHVDSDRCRCARRPSLLCPVWTHRAAVPIVAVPLGWWRRLRAARLS